MRLIFIIIILLSASFTLFGNDIKDLYLKAGSRGLALALEMTEDKKPVFSARRTAGGFEVAIKNSTSRLSLTEFTDFGSNSPFKSIQIVKKNGSILIKSVLKSGNSAKPASKWISGKILILANKNSYPEMNWRASEYDYDNSEDASFTVSEESEKTAPAAAKKIASVSVVKKDTVPKKSVTAIEPEGKIKAASVVSNLSDVSGDSYETIKGGVNFRSSSNSKNRDNIIAVLEKGVRGTMLASKGQWIKLKTERSGKVGWIHESLLRKNSETAIKGDDTEPEMEITDAKIVKMKRPVKKVQKKKSISAKPNIRKYRAFGRDPFLPLDKCDFLLPDLPNVEEATLVGVIYDNMDRIALIEIQGSKGLESYTLRENSNVYNGRVLKIRENEIVFLISEAMYSRQFVLKMKEKIEK